MGGSMLFRAIALSLALLIGIGAIVPLVTEHTEAGSYKKKKKKKRVKYKKYSKKWWRAYRQRKNRQSALAKRKRALRVRQILLARETDLKQVTEISEKSKTKVDKNSATVDSAPALLPSGEPAPKGWKSNLVSNSELQYRVDDDNGAQIGAASIAVVGPAMSMEGTSNLKNKSVGGVPTTSLRSTVIDRMIKEQGWVVNDFQKEIGGKKVYVVVAQSPGAGGTIQSRMFYFTEVDGRIYSVSTSSPNDSTEKIVQESEKVIDSLQRRKTNPQQAAIKE
jgi:hypothetical protein